MVKKGKDKATAPPPPPPQASAGSSKKSAKSGNQAPQEDDFIVFTNSTKDPRPKKAGQGSSKAKPADGEQLPEGPPKPTVKQIIGGSSWTGKLPVNLLSEHCQRQKWDRPDYQLVSHVVITATTARSLLMRDDYLDQRRLAGLLLYGSARSQEPQDP